MLLAGPEVPLTGGVVGVLVNDLRCLAPQDDRGSGSGRPAMIAFGRPERMGPVPASNHTRASVDTVLQRTRSRGATGDLTRSCSGLEAAARLGIC